MKQIKVNKIVIVKNNTGTYEILVKYSIKKFFNLININYSDLVRNPSNNNIKRFKSYSLALLHKETIENLGIIDLKVGKFKLKKKS